jgi:TPR repeat protein
MQLALADLHLYQGPSDGLIGNSTRRAISDWQARHGQRQTGSLDNRQTVDLLLEAAQAGGAKSQNLVGWMYGSGIGLPKDPAIARDWFEKSAHQGNAWAAYALGLMYRDGEGVTPSQEQARVWFQQARRDGHPQAEAELARLK